MKMINDKINIINYPSSAGNTLGYGQPIWGRLTMSILSFDPEKHYLGKLCCKGHDYKGTGKTLRYKPSPNRRCGACIICHREESRSRSNYYKLYYQKKRQKIIERVSTYTEKNQEKIRQWKRSYYKSPQGRLAQKRCSHRRRANLLHNHHFEYSSEKIQLLCEKFENRCAYCGKLDKLTLDHFIPISQGGSDCLGNIIPACKGCNSSKHSSDPLRWYKSQSFYSEKRWRKILKVLGKTEKNYNQLPLF